MSYQYQVAVIGSGSAGQEACLKASKAGLSTLLVEERTLGSNSFHGGSYAVRGLRACANYFKGTEKATKFGTRLDLVETSWTSWLNAQRRSGARLSAEFSEAIKRERVHLKSGRARIVGPHEISVIDPRRDINLQITSQYIILATGSRPNYSSQPEIGIMNSDHLLWQAKAARHLFVVGGGYVGCELAAIYRDLGSRVTIAEAQSRLLPNWDPIAGEQFRTVVLKAGIDVLLNEPIELPPPIIEKMPSYKLTTGAVIQPDITLVATGRKPNSDELGAGIRRLDRWCLDPCQRVYANGGRFNLCGRRRKRHPFTRQRCHRSSGHSSREHPGKTSPVRQKMVFSISSYRARDLKYRMDRGRGDNCWTTSGGTFLERLDF
jgi:pyruvate/2-oxoglutarate dehydrogenase complex dihydrolipoamide dehydrogenase (E3) component